MLSVSQTKDFPFLFYGGLANPHLLAEVICEQPLQSTSSFLEVPESTYKNLKIPGYTSKYIEVSQSTSTFLEVPQSTEK